MDQNKPPLKGIPVLLDETIAFYQTHWKIFLPILIVPLVPTILSLYVSSFISNTIIVFLIGIVGLTINIWAATAALYTVKRLVEDAKMLTIKRAYSESLPYILPLIGTQCIVGTLLLIGLFSRYANVPPFISLILVLIGFYVVIIGFAATFIVMFERIYYFAALKRSKKLVSRYLWPIIIRLGVLVVVVLGVEIFFVIIANALSVQIGGLVRVIINGLANTVIVPFTLYYTYAVYKNLRELSSQ